MNNSEKRVKREDDSNDKGGSMIEIGGQMFDEKCPKDCPGKVDSIGRGGLCHRCPIFNCVGSSEEILLLPEDYRFV